MLKLLSQSLESRELLWRCNDGRHYDFPTRRNDVERTSFVSLRSRRKVRLLARRSNLLCFYEQGLDVLVESRFEFWSCANFLKPRDIDAHTATKAGVFDSVYTTHRRRRTVQTYQWMFTRCHFRKNDGLIMDVRVSTERELRQVGKNDKGL